MNRAPFAVRVALAVTLLASLVLPMFFGAMSVAADSEAPAELEIEPGSARAGERVRLHGEEFAEDDEGTARWAHSGDDIAEFETDDDGEWEAFFNVPPFEPGVYGIIAVSGDVRVEGSFTILASDDGSDEDSDDGDSDDSGNEEPTRVPPEDDDSDEGDERPTEEATATSTPTEELSQADEPGSTGDIFVANNGSDNTGNGSAGSPYRTLQKALDAAQPGNVISLKNGTYTASRTVQSKRSGRSGAPITIQSAPGERAIISGPSNSRGVQINHSWYVIRNLEFTNSDILLWLDGASNVLITGNSFHHAGGECVRIKNQSSNNTFSHNRVSNCGLEGFNLASGSKNGEGIYLGTAPEQRDKIGGVPDRTVNNVIEYNVFTPNASESVDIKEDAEGNIVRFNVGSGNRDPEGANFGTRGDKNQFIGNESFNSDGAGFRAGGDTVGGRVYGKNNVFRQNNSHDNAMHAFKLMVAPQTVDCSNVSARDGGDVFHFGNGRFDILCQGDEEPLPEIPGLPELPEPVETPKPKPTPKPATRTFGATDDTQAASHVPTRKYGSSRTFRIDSNPQTIAYLKFKVTGIDASRIEKVTLRLYINDAGGSGLTLQQLSSKSWTEGGLNWNNRPRAMREVVGARTGGDESGTWIEFDLTDLVTANGTYSLALWSTSSDGYSFHSSEASSKRPELVVKQR